MSKPVIGVLSGIMRNIVPSNEEVITKMATSVNYFKAVEKAGGVPIMLPITLKENIDKQISLCDGFVFSGGLDINPLIYNEEPNRNLGKISVDLDEYQYSFIESVLETDKPFLAVCRGFQMLNIVKGGTLYQDLSEIRAFEPIQHNQLALSCERTQSITIEKDSILYELLGEKHYINSYHHQVLKKLGEGLKVVARTADTVIEAVEVEGKTFGVGVQWHPEHLSRTEDKDFKLFEMLVSKAK